jgi:magnesium transporter
LITLLKSTEFGLQQVENAVEGCWVNVVDPSPSEITRLCNDYNLLKAFITYPLDIDELARTTHDHNNLLIGLRVPVQQGETANIPYTTVPLAIIITEQVILTVCKTEIKLISDIAAGQIPSLSTSKKNQLTLHLLLAVADQYLAYLREINSKTDALEDKLQMSLRNKEVLELLKYQKSLILFATALKSNELIIGRLQKSHIFLKYEDDLDLLNDVLTEFLQALEMTDIASGMLGQMMDAFASIISNNLNVVMKLLASVTIVVSLPTLIASIYGMNIRLPIQDVEHAFILLMSLMVVLTLGVVIIFRKRNWM